MATQNCLYDNRIQKTQEKDVMKMNSSNQWLKIAGKILVALYVTLLLISCKNTVVADEIPASRQNQNAQPSKKIARDGQVLIRHAGDAWSRQMMREYLVNNKLNLDKTLTYKSAINDCQAIVPSMEKLKFKFIEPDIITDDWHDVRLDLYKKNMKNLNMAWDTHKPVQLIDTYQVGISMFTISILMEMVCLKLFYMAKDCYLGEEPKA